MTTQLSPGSTFEGGTQRVHESLLVERDGARAEVVLRGPGKGNAMGPAFFKELPAAFRELDGDPSVRVIVVRGDGGNFSYGLDLLAIAPEMAAFAAGGLAEERLRLLDLIGELQRA